MGKRLSFAEIGDLSDRAAKGLRAIGVGEGVKVGLLLPNTPTFVIFYYGVLKAGGTVVNFNPLYSLEEIEAQIRDSGAKIMVTLDLAMTFDKVEAMLRRGALDKAVVASFPALLPALKSVGFKLLQRTKLADPSSSLAANKIVTERELLANDGRCETPRDHARRDRRAPIYRRDDGNAQRSDAHSRQYLDQRQSGEALAAAGRPGGRQHPRHPSAVPRLRHDHGDEFRHRQRHGDDSRAEIRADRHAEADRQAATDA